MGALRDRQQRRRSAPLQGLFVTAADLRPDPSAGLLHVEIHRGSRPMVDRTLTALFDQLKEIGMLQDTRPPPPPRQWKF
ncbi:MAG: hypothetical protein NTW21_20190 [Verrucomicrobia bacterium]|nr:hypothetical protein [Verrucomicrobiota bacterium]